MWKNRFVAVLSALLALGGLFFLLNRYSGNEAEFVEPPIIEAGILEEQYNSQSGEILKSFVTNAQAVSPVDLKPLATDTKDRLLELRVSATAKDKHLGIVLALAKLEEGIEAQDQTMIDEAVEQFNRYSPESAQLKLND